MTRRGLLFLAIGMMSTGPAGGLPARQLSRVGVHEATRPHNRSRSRTGCTQVIRRSPVSIATSARERAGTRAFLPLNVCMNCHSILAAADRRDRKAERSRAAGQGDRVDQGPQPARLRLLQPQPARRRRGGVCRLSRSGGDDGSHPPGRATDDGLVPGLPQDTRPRPAAAAGGADARRSRCASSRIGLRQMPLLRADVGGEPVTGSAGAP